MYKLVAIVDDDDLAGLIAGHAQNGLGWQRWRLPRRRVPALTAPSRLSDLGRPYAENVQARTSGKTKYRAVQDTHNLHLST